MAQNITLMGASYSDVPSVTLPKTGGGTASFTDVTDTTATASDVASGKYFYTSAGVKTQGTSSGGGGGGASNLVTGTFKGTTTGTAMDITLNYTGSGYPVAVLIYVADSPYVSGNTFYNLVQRFAIGSYTLVKCDMTSTPDYSSTDTKNNAVTVVWYKGSSSTANNYSRGGGQSTKLYDDSNSTANVNGCVHIRSKTKMSVYIANTSYGFAANIEYK